MFVKHIILLIISLILTSCSNSSKDEDENRKENSLSNSPSIEEEYEENMTTSSEEKISLNKKKTHNYSYDLENEDLFKKDESLYMNRMLFAYPAEISAKEGDPYSSDDLKNLDYSKDIYYSLLNFRIPKRAEVFSSEEGLFAIDFPKTEAYDIKIYFKTFFEKEDFEDIKDINPAYLAALSFKKTSEKHGNKISGTPIEIFDDQKDAYYLIGQDGKFNHTYLFVTSPDNVVFFDIVEDKEKSDLSKYIMADLLSTIYIDTEDPIHVGKNLNSYMDKIDLYPTNEIDFNSFSVKIPQTMEKLQEDENFKAYAIKDKRDTVSQMIFIKNKKTDENKEELSLVDAFNQTTGSKLQPAYIVPMGEVKKEKIKNKNSLVSEIRIYIDNATSQGMMTTIETEDEFITIILTGPLANANETKLLNKNVLNSLNFK